MLIIIFNIFLKFKLKLIKKTFRLTFVTFSYHQNMFGSGIVP